MDIKPVSIDSKGSGLYSLGAGAMAFIDFEHPEDRMMRHLSEADDDYEAWWEYYYEQCRLDAESLGEYERWAYEQEQEIMDWREFEEPSGDMSWVASGEDSLA